MNKVIALLLTISAPIWFIPAAILFILAMGFTEAYKEIFRLLNKI